MEARRQLYGEQLNQLKAHCRDAAPNGSGAGGDLSTLLDQLQLRSDALDTSSCESDEDSGGGGGGDDDDDDDEGDDDVDDNESCDGDDENDDEYFTEVRRAVLSRYFHRHSSAATPNKLCRFRRTAKLTRRREFQRLLPVWMR